ncbi:MAG: hypothetical protein AAGK71_11105 [Pseudomonadota bacterium]
MALEDIKDTARPTRAEMDALAEDMRSAPIKASRVDAELMQVQPDRQTLRADDLSGVKECYAHLHTLRADHAQARRGAD